MNRSPLSDFNRRRSIFDSPNFVRFINKTLHSKDKKTSNLDSTTTSSSHTYSTYNPNQNHRVAITRKLTNMNEPSPLQLNRGRIYQPSFSKKNISFFAYRYYSIKSDYLG
jgi:hypothetical protein